MRRWPHLVPKTVGIYTLLHPDNECQWSVTDLWSGISGNLDVTS